MSPQGHAIRKERERIWRFPVPISYVITGGESQLELVLVSQLVSSLPVFEYELGSLAASSLVTPSCPCFRGRDCVVPV
jgi:hypothetical protein